MLTVPLGRRGERGRPGELRADPCRCGEPVCGRGRPQGGSVLPAQPGKPMTARAVLGRPGGRSDMECLRRVSPGPPAELC